MHAGKTIRAAATAVLASAALFAGGIAAGAPAALADGPDTSPQVRQQIQECSWVDLQAGAEDWRVKSVEHLLAEWGHYNGEPDEVYTEGTGVAVHDFRVAMGLPEGSTIDPDTWESLRGAFGIVGQGTEEEPSQKVHAVQTALTAQGYDIKRAEATDGLWGSVTEQSVREFQADAGIDADGDVGPDTFKALLAEDGCTA
ncbi:peptidoglycan-binding domain-containing protein [Nocardiopsis coralliicola]